MVSLSLILIYDRPALILLDEDCNKHKGSRHKREDECLRQLLHVRVDIFLAEDAQSNLNPDKTYFKF